MIKMNTLGLQSVWNSLSAQASSPSLALALHRRIVSLGILCRRPTQRGARAGRLHLLWHSHPLHTAPQSALTSTTATASPSLSRVALPVSLFHQRDQTPVHPSSRTSTQFSVETQVYETVIKMNTLGLQLVWNRLSAQASSPSLALALHRRIVSLGILSRRPTQRGARAGQLHRLWHS